MLHVRCYEQAMKARSAARSRVKVGRLEPGDLWGMQHAHDGVEAGFEIVAVEGCEVHGRARVEGLADLRRPWRFP